MLSALSTQMYTPQPRKMQQNYVLNFSFDYIRVKVRY
jgi:hypothetical protein